MGGAQPESPATAPVVLALAVARLPARGSAFRDGLAGGDGDSPRRRAWHRATRRGPSATCGRSALRCRTGGSGAATAANGGPSPGANATPRTREPRCVGVAQVAPAGGRHLEGVGLRTTHLRAWSPRLRFGCASAGAGGRPAKRAAAVAPVALPPPERCMAADPAQRWQPACRLVRRTLGGRRLSLSGDSM